MDVKKTQDNVNALLAKIGALTKQEVVVGIPSAKAGRKSGAITNASLAYIHEFGSPAHNIPARPFLYPGIRRARKQVVAILKKGAQETLQGAAADGQAIAIQTLHKVGLAARNAVVREITNPTPPFVPLKAATVRARLRKTAAGRRKLRSFKSNDALMTWAGEGNVKPLIDSGQLRASVSYVVRSKP